MHRRKNIGKVGELPTISENITSTLKNKGTLEKFNVRKIEKCLFTRRFLGAILKKQRFRATGTYDRLIPAAEYFEIERAFLALQNLPGNHSSTRIDHGYDRPGGCKGF